MTLADITNRGSQAVPSQVSGPSQSSSNPSTISLKIAEPVKEEGKEELKWDFSGDHSLSEIRSAIRTGQVEKPILVLDIDQTLVHVVGEEELKEGCLGMLKAKWRDRFFQFQFEFGGKRHKQYALKRQGVDEFLEELSPYF